MDCATLVEVVAKLRATPKKTDKILLLADVLRKTRGRETALAAFYLTGALPQGRVGVGWRIIEEAAVSGSGSGPPLTLAEVDAAFDRIAALQGPGSSERRIEALRALLSRARQDERRFLAELIMGELRQGALEGLLIEAVAKAAALPSSEVRRAMMFSGSIGVVARAALEEGAAGLSRLSFRLFAPVAPMLAQSAERVSEALERLGEAAFEFKVDGARVQLHKGGDEIRIFTRQLQDVTERLPEVVQWTRALPPRELVLDGEAIALRPGGRPHPFQVTMRRFGRSRHIEALRHELPMTAFFFDLMYLDGEPLFTTPYQERYRALARTLPAGSLLPRLITGDPQAAAGWLDEAFRAGHEGLMAKSLTAPYAAGQRGFHWLKIKGAQTLDLVVLAGEWGSGRREGWLSNLHLGARDPETGRFIMLGKTFKGLTDELLRWQTERLLAIEVARERGIVYVRPELVVEVAFSGIQRSPRYPAGLALRLARVKRYRPDKSPAEADTIQAVQELLERGMR